MTDRNIVPGTLVKHYAIEESRGYGKGDNCYLYRVISCDGYDSETGERYVIYQSLYAPFTIYTRKYDVFMRKVDRTKNPNIKQTFEFENITPEERRDINYHIFPQYGVTAMFDSVAEEGDLCQ